MNKQKCVYKEERQRAIGEEGRTGWSYDIMFYDEEGSLIERPIEFFEDYENLKEFSITKRSGYPTYLSIEFIKQMNQQKMMRVKEITIRGERRKLSDTEWLEQEYKEEAELLYGSFNKEDVVGVVVCETIVLKFDVNQIDEVGAYKDSKNRFMMTADIIVDLKEEMFLEFPSFYEIKEDGVIKHYVREGSMKLASPKDF